MNFLTPTDKKKSESDILLDAVMDIRAGITGSVQYEEILKVVSERYGVDWMCRTSIRKRFGLARKQRICMYLLHELSGLGYDEIAEVMEQKGSIYVVRNIERIIADMRNDEKLRNEVLEIVEELK